MNKLNYAFTLVELLVVISIIGILSSVVYVNFSDSKKIARDEIRKTTLKDLQLAINLYKSQNGRYPDGCNTSANPIAWSGTVSGPSFKCTNGSNYYIKGLVPDFISVLPFDNVYPTGNKGYIYRTNSDGTDFKLLSYDALEKDKVASGDDFARCPILDTDNCKGADTWDKTFAVYSAGATTW